MKSSSSPPNGIKCKPFSMAFNPEKHAVVTNPLTLCLQSLYNQSHPALKRVRVSALDTIDEQHRFT